MARELRVGILDSDSGFIQVVRKRLERDAVPVRVIGGPVPPAALREMRINLLIIDPAVLGPRASDLLEDIIRVVPELGLLVCAAPSSTGQRVRALRAGVDDWLTKPCHPEEVEARARAILRGRHRDEAPVTSSLGEIELRGGEFQAFARGRSLDLTRREFELLHWLSTMQGKVLQREQIYQHVWGYAMAHGDRSVDVFIRKLRAKLADASPEWTYIHTHFGVGYRFEPVPGRPVA